MKIRKGQRTIKLKQKVDKIVGIIFESKDGFTRKHLLADTFENIVAKLSTKEGAEPDRFCAWDNNLISLQDKSSMSGELKIYGEVLVRQ